MRILFIGDVVGKTGRTAISEHLPGAITGIGLAFAVQEIKNVPMQPHDVALDYVLTETKVFDFRS